MTVPLEDISDVPGYAAEVAGVALARDLVGDHEFEEVKAEAIALILELHTTWDPEKMRSFSAYASQLVMKRLIDWQRRELRQSGQGTRHEDGSWSLHGLTSLNDSPSYLDRVTGSSFTNEERIDRALVYEEVARIGD